MMRTASASDLLDATNPPAVGAEIDERCPRSLPSSTTEKRKHAETGDESEQSQPPPKERRNLGVDEEQPLESLPPRVKQGGCKCKGVEHEGCKCEGGGEREEMSFDKLPADVQQYFLRLKARHGDRVIVFPARHGDRGTHCTDDDLIGGYGDLLEDHPTLSWGGEDYTDCCSNPFNALDFKQDPKVYNELRVFGEKAVAFLNSKYNETVCFEDIERVTSCPASCKHHVVTIKAKGPCEEVWEIVLRGKVRGGFPEAKAHEFVMLEYHRV